MSFDAKVAMTGDYHNADLSDPRNWPRPRKQQNPQQEITDEVIKDEKTPEVTEEGVAAIADNEDGK